MSLRLSIPYELEINTYAHSTGGTDEIKQYQLNTPIISHQSKDEIYEKNYIEIDIENYVKGIEYEFDSELVVKYIYRYDKTFRLYFGAVEDDTDLKFRIRAKAIGYLASEWSDELSLTIKNKDEESDDSIINDEFLDNIDKSEDADVTNEKVYINENNGWYKEVITEQGDDEENWSSYQTIARIELDKMTIIDDETDTDTLAVRDEGIKDVSKCYITNDDYPDGVEIDVGDVTDDSEDTKSKVDIFGDGTCIELFEFEGNLAGTSGDYSMEDKSDGKISFEDNGKFGKYLKKYDANGDDSKGYPIRWDEITDKIDDNDRAFAISMFVKFDSENQPDNYYRLYDFYHRDKAYIYITTDFTEFNIDGVKKDVSEYIKNDEWVHILLVYSDYVNKDHDVDVYINKNYVDTWSCDGVNSKSQNSGFGGDNDSEETNYWAPMFDQVRIFDRDSFTTEEIEDLYNEKHPNYKADISSNELDNAPDNAYFKEENTVISTALTKDNDPVDPDDFNDETLNSWKIDTDNDYKENTYKKVEDYSGNKFQRKISGNKKSNIIYLKSDMWKEV